MLLRVLVLLVGIFTSRKHLPPFHFSLFPSSFDGSADTDPGGAV